MSDDRAERRPVFYGWWMVLGCLLVAVVGCSLGIFGMGVYIHALSEERGFAISLISSAVMLTSVGYGLTVGNLTTLSPLVVRREFGAASFGAIYGVAGAVISFASAFGPGLFGMLRDLFEGYGYALLIGALLNVAAAAVIVWGGRAPLNPPA